MGCGRKGKGKGRRGNWLEIAFIGLLMFGMMGGCTVNKKYVEVRMTDEASLLIDGDIDPTFMREGTAEIQTNTPDLSPELDLAPMSPIPGF